MQLPLLPIKNLDQRHKGISQPLADSYVEALVQCLLTRHLSTYDDHTRRFAMQSLRKIGIQHAIELLRKILNGSEGLTRLRAQETLASLEDPQPSQS